MTIMKDNETVISALTAAIVLVALGGFVVGCRRELLSTFLTALIAAAGFTVAVAAVIRDLSAGAILLLGFSFLTALGVLLTLWRSSSTS